MRSEEPKFVAVAQRAPIRCFGSGTLLLAFLGNKNVESCDGNADGAELQRPKGSDTPSWEYHVEHFLTDTPIEAEVLRDGELLNVFGAEGWELVCVLFRPKTPDLEEHVFCFFKRRVTNTKPERPPFDDE